MSVIKTLKVTIALVIFSIVHHCSAPSLEEILSMEESLDLMTEVDEADETEEEEASTSESICINILGELFLVGDTNGQTNFINSFLQLSLKDIERKYGKYLLLEDEYDEIDPHETEAERAERLSNIEKIRIDLEKENEIRHIKMQIAKNYFLRLFQTHNVDISQSLTPPDFCRYQTMQVARAIRKKNNTLTDEKIISICEVFIKRLNIPNFHSVKITEIFKKFYTEWSVNLLDYAGIIGIKPQYQNSQGITITQSHIKNFSFAYFNLFYKLVAKLNEQTKTALDNIYESVPAYCRREGQEIIKKDYLHIIEIPVY